MVDGRPRCAGGPDRVLGARRRDQGGERLTDLPITLFSDPMAPGLACTPFVAASSSSETLSVFDNGMEISQVDWIRDGVINALAYPRATADKYDAPVAVAADNLVMTGDRHQGDMIEATERGLLLTTLWYIRVVDPTTLLFTGLTRDGVYSSKTDARPRRQQFPVQRKPAGPAATGHRGRREREDAAARNGDWATRAAMPSLRIPDFHMSSVSQAQ